LEKVEERTEVHISRKIEANYGLSQVLIWLGLYTEAVEGFRRMAKEAESLGDTGLQARAWHGIAEAQMHRGEFRAANDSADQALTLAQASGDSLMITKAVWMKAWGAFRLGEMGRALSLAEQVASLSPQLQDPSQMAHSFNLLGVLQSTLGHYEEASGYFEQALTIFRKVGNRLRAMPLMNNLGVIAEARGDYQEALRYYQEALNTALEMGNRDGEMVYLSNQGGAKVQVGEFRSAEEDLIRVIDMAGPSGQDVLSSTYSFLALACLGQGKTQEALVSAQNALSMAEDMESPDDMGLAWRALGRVAAFMESTISTRINGEDRHKITGAEECFAESERIYKEIQREDERARTLREWAKYHFVQGNPQTGVRMWKEARAIFTQLGAYMEVDRMEEIHAT
jgi:tetratricopeptide (TPR) repeat protein